MPKQPAYLTIKNSILANIHSGTWQEGSAIPAEISLAETFGVSRMTVNRALKELEAERILERRQGSGTYVAQQKYNNAHIEIRNIAKDIREHYSTYHAEVVSSKHKKIKCNFMTAEYIYVIKNHYENLKHYYWNFSSY